MTIKVLVADDQNIVRQGLEMMLKDVREIELVGYACDGKETLRLIEETLPDILVLDVEMPDISGLTLTRQLASQSIATKVIILSAYEKNAYVAEALDAGAKGYLSKDAILEDLSWAIQLVYRGYSAFRSDLLQEVTDNHRLSYRECQQRVALLEIDLDRQKLERLKRSTLKGILLILPKIKIIKTLFLPIVYLKKKQIGL